MSRRIEYFDAYEITVVIDANDARLIVIINGVGREGPRKSNR